MPEIIQAEKPRRCSALSRELSCHASMLPAAHPYNPDSEVASMGSAAHETMAIELAELPPDLDAIATAHAADREELGILYAQGCKVLRAIRGWLTDPMPEVAMQNDLFRGKADVVSVGADNLIVVDWKFGRVEANPWPQLRGYVDLALETFFNGKMPAVGHVTAIAAWPRLGTYEVRNYNEAEMRDFREAVITAGMHTNRFAPGECCTYCPHQLECVARENFARSSYGALVPVADGGEVTDAKLAELYPRLAMLREGLRRVDALYKERLRFGPIALGDGRELYLREEERETIDAAEAWSVLVEAVGLDAALGAMSLSKKGLKGACDAVAAKGQKAKLNREVLGELKKAGAVSTTTIQKRDVRKTD